MVAGLKQHLKSNLNSNIISLQYSLAILINRLGLISHRELKPKRDLSLATIMVAGHFNNQHTSPGAICPSACCPQCSGVSRMIQIKRTFHSLSSFYDCHQALTCALRRSRRLDRVLCISWHQLSSRWFIYCPLNGVSNDHQPEFILFPSSGCVVALSHSGLEILHSWNGSMLNIAA